MSPDPSTELTGHCTCGGVRFAVTPPSRFVCHCHCDNCRRAHGAAFVTWLGLPRAQFRLTEGEELLGEFRTETDSTRSFCTRCGTPMFFASPRWEGEIHVAVALLDQDPDQPPKARVYADRAPSWGKAPPDLPHYGGSDGTQPLRMK